MRNGHRRSALRNTRYFPSVSLFRLCNVEEEDLVQLPTKKKVVNEIRIGCVKNMKRIVDDIVVALSSYPHLESLPIMFSNVHCNHCIDAPFHIDEDLESCNWDLNNYFTNPCYCNETWNWS
ncbi:hypothetical protein E2542_SST05037 [Spatholobus suberectus]|nr:hypothetical protein E2542_SST05037 [Spatholobus suberectus]